MSEIDRFDWVHDGDGDYYMSASPSGHWVKFEAHEARVITLERALREAFGAMNYMGDILNGMDAVLPEDAAKITPAFATVHAALGDH